MHDLTIWTHCTTMSSCVIVHCAVKIISPWNFLLIVKWFRIWKKTLKNSISFLAWKKKWLLDRLTAAFCTKFSQLYSTARRLLNLGKKTWLFVIFQSFLTQKKPADRSYGMFSNVSSREACRPPFGSCFVWYSSCEFHTFFSRFSDKFLPVCGLTVFKFKD